MRDDLELLGERIAEHSTHIDAAMHRLLTDIRTFDAGGGWYTQGAKTCAHWLSWRVGWSLGTAREHVRVATKLASLPVIDDALSRGLVSYSKVRAMTRVATPANEALLLEDAHFTDAAQLERICRTYALVQRAPVSAKEASARRYVTRRDTNDGMVMIEAALHPDEATIVWTALDRVAKEATADAPVPQEATADVPKATRDVPAGIGDQTRAETNGADVPAGTRRVDRTNAPLRPQPARTRPFDRATALVTAAQDILRGTRRERTPVDVVITISKEALTGTSKSPLDAMAVTSDGSCISVEAARRHCCDAGIIEMVEDEHGTPLSVGRKKRSSPAPLKRALEKRDPHCRFPGCTNRVFLEGHHIVHWIDGGETSLENQLRVCSHHHRFVHEYGFHVEMTAEGPLFFDADNRVILSAPPMRRPAVLGLPALIAQNQQLQITPETAMCGWDGRPIDYDLVIEDLARADDGT